MAKIDLTYNEITYTVIYEKSDDEIIITSVLYMDKDITPVLDSLNFDYGDLTDLIEDHERSRRYERDYDL